jgi:hypothetical protein
VQLEKTLGFRPAINLKALPLDEIRENVRKGAMATDKLFPPPVFEGMLVEDRYVEAVDKEKILVRVYQPGTANEAKFPVCVLWALSISADFPVIMAGDLCLEMSIVKMVFNSKSNLTFNSALQNNLRRSGVDRCQRGLSTCP